MQTNRTWILPLIITIVFVVILCCLCMLIFGAVSWLILSPQSGPVLKSPSVFSLQEPTSTPQVVRPTPINTPGSPAQEIIVPVSDRTLKTLEETIIPINDLPELATRLGGKTFVPLTVDPPERPYQPGDRKNFWATDVGTDENFQVEAQLEYVTDHLYFWVADGVRFDREDLTALADTFENEIYPTNREFFGSEWTPGVDGDPHLHILFAQNLGFNVAGYFSSADEYSPLAHEYSNAHEMFFLNADNLDLQDDFTYGVLAHEFQHMIHWNRDRNESSWLNEGFSELAAFLNGYEVGGFDWLYTRNPDLQLNDWPNDPNATSPHYGASFLFLAYFLDRFGDEATKALVGNQDNGITSVDSVLSELQIVGPEDGVALSADDLFADWVIASYLQDGSVGDGRFTYHNYPDAPQPEETETIQSCPLEQTTRDVHQYGVDYIRISCRGDFTLTFEGSTQVKVISEAPHSGDFAFWSNKSDESDMTLTRHFDFSNSAGPLTLTYWTEYDLEEDYDYLYLLASTDGKHWQILTTPSGTANDPSGNSYGWAYTGNSQGWIQEQVDLSQFAGQKIQLRFEYVTDAAVHGEGLLLDDLSIPEIGYSADFEQDDESWQAEGWVRLENVLPQTYRLALITKGDQINVQYLDLGADNRVEVPLSLGAEVDEAVLVVSGTTRFTRQKAAYRFSIH